MKRCILMLLIVNASILFSQEEYSTRFWANAGLGFNSMTIGLNVNANLNIDNVLLTLKFSEYGEILGNSFRETGCLVGYVMPSSNSHLSIAGGFAEGEYNKSRGGILAGTDKISYFGFITELQYCYLIWDFLGVGATMYGNINKAKNVFGVNFNLFIGSLNRK